MTSRQIFTFPYLVIGLVFTVFVIGVTVLAGSPHWCRNGLCFAAGFIVMRAGEWLGQRFAAAPQE